MHDDADDALDEQRAAERVAIAKQRLVRAEHSELPLVCASAIRIAVERCAVGRSW